MFATHTHVAFIINAGGAGPTACFGQFPRPPLSGDMVGKEYIGSFRSVFALFDCINEPTSIHYTRHPMCVRALVTSACVESQTDELD